MKPVENKKPSNKKLFADEHLAEAPKKKNSRVPKRKGPRYLPSNKKLSSETSLQKTHKLVHISDFENFKK